MKLFLKNFRVDKNASSDSKAGNPPEREREKDFSILKQLLIKVKNV